MQEYTKTLKNNSPGEDIGGGGTNGGGGENGGDPGQGRPVTGPQRSKLLAKLSRDKKNNKKKEPSYSAKSHKSKLENMDSDDHQET